jgi:hypothetical protein
MNLAQEVWSSLMVSLQPWPRRGEDLEGRAAQTLSCTMATLQLCEQHASGLDNELRLNWDPLKSFGYQEALAKSANRNAQISAEEGRHLDACTGERVLPAALLNRTPYRYESEQELDNGLLAVEMRAAEPRQGHALSSVPDPQPSQAIRPVGPAQHVQPASRSRGHQEPRKSEPRMPSEPRTLSEPRKSEPRTLSDTFAAEALADFFEMKGWKKRSMAVRPVVTSGRPSVAAAGNVAPSATATAPSSFAASASALSGPRSSREQAGVQILPGKARGGMHANAVLQAPRRLGEPLLILASEETMARSVLVECLEASGEVMLLEAGAERMGSCDLVIDESTCVLLRTAESFSTEQGSYKDYPRKIQQHASFYRTWHIIVLGKPGAGGATERLLWTAEEARNLSRLQAAVSGAFPQSTGDIDVRILCSLSEADAAHLVVGIAALAQERAPVSIEEWRDRSWMAHAATRHEHVLRGLVPMSALCADALLAAASVRHIIGAPTAAELHDTCPRAPRSTLQELLEAAQGNIPRRPQPQQQVAKLGASPHMRKPAMEIAPPFPKRPPASPPASGGPEMPPRPTKRPRSSKAAPVIQQPAIAAPVPPGPAAVFEFGPPRATSSPWHAPAMLPAPDLSVAPNVRRGAFPGRLRTHPEARHFEMDEPFALPDVFRPLLGSQPILGEDLESFHQGPELRAGAFQHTKSAFFSSNFSEEEDARADGGGVPHMSGPSSFFVHDEPFQHVPQYGLQHHQQRQRVAPMMGPVDAFRDADFGIEPVCDEYRPVQHYAHHGGGRALSGPTVPQERAPAHRRVLDGPKANAHMGRPALPSPPGPRRGAAPELASRGPKQRGVEHVLSYVLPPNANKGQTQIRFQGRVPKTPVNVWPL